MVSVQVSLFSLLRRLWNWLTECFEFWMLNFKFYFSGSHNRVHDQGQATRVHNIISTRQLAYNSVHGSLAIITIYIDDMMCALVI